MKKQQTFDISVINGKIDFKDKIASSIWLEIIEGKENLKATIGQESLMRTERQNRALHKYFELVAEQLVENSVDFNLLIRSIDIQATPENIKNVFWRNIQIALLNKVSTTALTTDEIDKVYEHTTRELAKFGVFVPFPSLDESIIDLQI